MKKTYNNILDAFKSVFGSGITLNTTFNDLNPLKEVSSMNYDSIIPGHVQEFLDQKQKHKKKGKK